MGAAPSTTPPTGPTRLPQRPIGGRISTGHVATLVIGVAAAVLTYAVLRGGSSVEAAFAAHVLRPNEEITDKSFRFESMRLPASARDQVLTRAGVARFKGGRILVQAEKGALVTMSMVTEENYDANRRVPLQVEDVPPDLRQGDLVEVGRPGKGTDDIIVLSRAATAWCADVTKPFNQILYVYMPHSESKLFFGLPSGKVRFHTIPRDPSRPPGPLVGPCVD